MVGYVFIFLGLLAAIFAVIYPFLGLITTMLVAMVGTGTAIYFFPVFAGIGWAGPILGLFLWAKSIMEMLRGRLPGFPAVFGLMLLFLFFSLISITNNIGHFQEIFTEVKNYFAYWGITFAVYFLIKDEKQMRKVMMLLLFIALLQVPVSLYQQIFIVSHQHRTAPGDSIVGTFGGNPEAGGSSGAQTIFLITVVGSLAAGYLRDKIGLLKFLMLTGVLMVPVLLNETKIIFFLVPIIALLLVWVFFREQVFKTSVMVLAMLSVGMVVGLFYFTYLQHGYSDEKAETIEVYIDRLLSKTVEKERVNNRGLGRLGAPIYWASEIKITEDPIKFLFGHGIGSTKSSGLVVGHLNLERKYSGKGIGVTGVSKLLWEVGLAGTICFFSIWSVALLKAVRRIKLFKKKVSKSDPRSILLFGASVGALMVMATAFYDTYLFRTAAYNFFSYLSLGAILFYCREARSGRHQYQLPHRNGSNG